MNTPLALSVIFTLQQQKSAPSFKHFLRSQLNFRKSTMQITIVSQGRVKKSSDTHSFTPLPAFFYACLFKYELVTAVILTMKTDPCEFHLCCGSCSYLKAIGVFAQQELKLVFPLHSLFELMKSELLYVSFQGQGFVFTCQLHETCCSSTEISFRCHALGLFNRDRRITLATQHYVIVRKLHHSGIAS